MRWVRVKTRIGTKQSSVVEDGRRMRDDAEVATSGGAFPFVGVLVTAESLRGVELARTVLAREETVTGGM